MNTRQVQSRMGMLRSGLLLALLVAGSAGSVGAREFDHSHSQFDAMLKTHVKQGE